MKAFTEIRVRGQEGDPDFRGMSSDEVRAADQDALDKLLAASTDAKLREFTAEWFPFTCAPRSRRMPNFDEEIRAASDARELMVLTLRLKQMVDEGTCSKEGFEHLGARFYEGGAEEREQSELYFLFTSTALADYLRGTNRSEAIEARLQAAYDDAGEEDDLADPLDLPPFATIGYARGRLIKQEFLHADGQHELAESLEDGEAYPVMPIFGGNLDSAASYGPERAYFFIDSIMRYCLQGVKVGAKHGVLDATADTHFTSMWIRLSETFRTSRVSMCKACGLPIIAIGERGTKRLYCSDSCKRKYKRALKFVSLVNDGEEESVAAKTAGVAASTAYRMVGDMLESQHRPSGRLE